MKRVPAQKHGRLEVDGRRRKMGGVACIRGRRIPLVTIVAMVAGRLTFEEILNTSLH
jgi:uncharacterized protein (DUF433 family)